ncbi:MAG: hypothetical protein R3310_04775, partial [Candidatus Competibacteraceae bacterium]|nr:hypothetical protein [Candidatus Competibacteraceae bacterium]
AEETEPVGVTPRPGDNVSTVPDEDQGFDTDVDEAGIRDWQAEETEPEGVTPQPGSNVGASPPTPSQ